MRRDLRWLPVVARIRFKLMEPAYKEVELPLPTVRRWSDHTPQLEHPTLHSLSWMTGTAIAQSKQRLQSQLFCFGTTMVERAQTSVLQSRSPASARDSKLTCSDFTWTQYSLPPWHCWKHPSYALIVCLDVQALNVPIYCMLYVLEL